MGKVRPALARPSRTLRGGGARLAARAFACVTSASLLLAAASASLPAFGQGPDGEVRTSGRAGTVKGKGKSVGRREVVERLPPCKAGLLVVNCGMPGCEVVVDGKRHGPTGASGTLNVEATGGKHSVSASRPPDFTPASTEVKLECGMTKEVPLTLVRRGVSLAIRTEPPECDIFLDEAGGGLKPQGRSDAKGLARYQTTSGSVLIEARKPGYLSVNRLVSVTPEAAGREIVLKLEPLPASLSVATEVEGASVSVDGQGAQHPARETLQLSPGRHRVSVEALGYAPAVFEAELRSGATHKETVKLQRLPVASLAAAAEEKYRSRAYGDVLTLCRYIFEASADDAFAHRLAGMVHLMRQNYGEAGQHLARALSGGAAVSLPVRRHPQEAFDVNKGHDTCGATLTLRKGTVEFRGAQFAAEDFSVSSDNVKVVGLQLKQGRAAYLSLKVSYAPGKTRNYNLYSSDKELSAAGTPFLNMIQRLLQQR